MQQRFVKTPELVRPVACELDHCRFFAVVGHEHVQQRFVGLNEFRVRLGEDAVADEDAKLVLQGDVVAGESLHEMPQGFVELVALGGNLGQRKAHPAVVGVFGGHGFQDGRRGVEFVHGHVPFGQAELKVDALWKVFHGLLDERPQVVGARQGLKDQEGLHAHVFVESHVCLVAVHDRQRRHDVAVHKQAVGAFHQRFQIPRPGRHEGDPIFGGADAVATSQTGFAPMVRVPRVFGLKFQCPVQGQLGGFEPLEFQVNFGQVEVEGSLLRVGLDALEESAVGVVPITLEQVLLALEVSPLDVGAVGQAVVAATAAQFGHHGALRQSQHGHRPQHPTPLHPAGVPITQKSPMLASSALPCQWACAPTIAPSTTTSFKDESPPTRLRLTTALRTVVPAPKLT